ncbi:hypothetical protein V5O48_013521 [Marasmius crinis-equi]|uniref:Uncharacterized protein n=1 Tax=Marasmius crinis-equi TaxID=585013 RepID=A0ABR3EZV4_9AGAR
MVGIPIRRCRWSSAASSFNSNSLTTNLPRPLIAYTSHLLHPTTNFDPPLRIVEYFTSFLNEFQLDRHPRRTRAARVEFELEGARCKVAELKTRKIMTSSTRPSSQTDTIDITVSPNTRNTAYSHDTPFRRLQAHTRNTPSPFSVYLPQITLLLIIKAQAAYVAHVFAQPDEFDPIHESELARMLSRHDM